MLRHWHSAPAFEVADTDVPTFQATLPVVAHTLNQAAAALALREQGLTFPAIANVRVAFEHALVAQWVVLTHGGEGKLVGQVRRHHQKMVDDVQRAGVTLPTQLAEPTAETGTLPSFRDIADRFDGGTRNIYSVYRDLTGGIHVSLATMTAYLDRKGDGIVPELHLFPKPYEGAFFVPGDRVECCPGADRDREPPP